MKVNALSIARAFVDIAKSLAAEDQGALADAAIHLLVEQGLLKECRTFPALVERVWRKQEGIVPVHLTTTTGNAGPAAQHLLRIIESSLKKSCVLEEWADASIVGGLLLSVGDERFDATLRSSLVHLASRLLEPLPLSS